MADQGVHLQKTPVNQLFVPPLSTVKRERFTPTPIARPPSNLRYPLPPLPVSNPLSSKVEQQVKESPTFQRLSQPLISDTALGKRKAEDYENHQAQASPINGNLNSDIKPNTDPDPPKPVIPVPILPIPLPSKRFKKRPTSKAVLIPVEQLPVFALPPLPTIDDPELVKQVFTHASLFEKVRGQFEDPIDNPARHYEKLEHVGDSILGMVVTTWLHETKPRLTIGTATKLKSHLVSNATLSHISGLYNFPQRLNGDPQLLPVLRAQTDVRAALVEAYIAALYFSYPPCERVTKGLAAVDTWLREMYEPLYDFFYEYMKNEYDQHQNATGAGPDGIILSEPEMLKIDNRAVGMAALVQMYATKQNRAISWEDERFETTVGVLWKMRLLIDGIEMGEATRAVRKTAKNVAAWYAAKKLGLAAESP